MTTTAEPRLEMTRRESAEYFSGILRRCPDCDADAEMVEHSPGMLVLAIRHDGTCPHDRAMSGRRP
jgi:hypothetical protein